MIIPEKYKVWVEARKKYKLSDAQIQMARELNLNPKKFGKIANHKHESWKVPLPEFIEELYIEHFGKNKPDVVKSIEQIIESKKS
uniref:Uncharacterized protein n=1 Tax=Chlorobium chlorochromatii (strain CaD3) TaxID=340177 RepID=Q3ARB6_CHLCH